MFIKSTFGTMLLTASLALSASTQANTVTVEQLAGAMFAQSVSSTQEELRNSIQGAVLTAANMFSLEDEGVYATKVTITDLNEGVDNDVAKQAE